jgi:hypothetical protein
VPIAFNILIALVAFIPALAIVDGQPAREVVALLIIATFAMAIRGSTSIDVERAVKLTRWLILIALIPAIWLLVQAGPSPNGALSNSLWITAAEALHKPLSKHISIDLDRTINALVEYLVAVTLILVAILVSRDRRRAALLLYCLCLITAFAVAALALLETGIISRVDNAASHFQNMLFGIASLGLVLNLAAGVRTIEKKSKGDEPLEASAWIVVILCFANLIICLVAVVKLAPINTGLVVSFGVLSFSIICIIRRFRLEAWSSLTLGFTAILMVGMTISWRHSSVSAQLISVQFAQAPAETISTAQRMLLDSPWTGSGPGAFSALGPIYSTVGENATQAPTTAASMLIEGGLPVFMTAVLGSALLFVILVRGALARQRDFVFPAAAASCVAIVFGESFCDASLSTTGVALITEVVIGLGLAQSVSSETHSVAPAIKLPEGY